MNTLAHGALELRDLLERFASLSDAGVRACLAGDPEALAATLDARDLVAGLTRDLVRQVTERQNGTGAESVSDVDQLLAPVRRAAGDATTANERLLRHAEELRFELGRQIDQLRQEAGASAAYTAEFRPVSGAYRALR